MSKRRISAFITSMTIEQLEDAVYWEYKKSFADRCSQRLADLNATLEDKIAAQEIALIESHHMEQSV